jgi:hypothetical protein
VHIAHKNAVAIQNEFFTKFFGIVSPCLLLRSGAKGRRDPQVVNELADCWQATFLRIFLFRLLPVTGWFLNGAEFFRVVGFGFGFGFGGGRFERSPCRGWWRWL